MFDSLKRLLYSREDYIRLAGNDILQQLKQQSAFKGLSPESLISIDPSSGKYIITNSMEEAIITGLRQFGHSNFYCSRIDNPPGLHNRFSDTQLLQRGERVFHQLKNKKRLDDIASSSFIAIEPQQGRYVIGDSREDVIKKGLETFGYDRMYVRPIDDRLIPRLSF